MAASRAAFSGPIRRGTPSGHGRRSARPAVPAIAHVAVSRGRLPQFIAQVVPTKVDLPSIPCLGIRRASSRGSSMAPRTRHRPSSAPKTAGISQGEAVLPSCPRGVRTWPQLAAAASGYGSPHPPAPGHRARPETTRRTPARRQQQLRRGRTPRTGFRYAVRVSQASGSPGGGQEDIRHADRTTVIDSGD